MVGAWDLRRAAYSVQRTACRSQVDDPRRVHHTSFFLFKPSLFTEDFDSFSIFLLLFSSPLSFLCRLVEIVDCFFSVPCPYIIRLISSLQFPQLGLTIHCRPFHSVSTLRHSFQSAQAHWVSAKKIKMDRFNQSKKTFDSSPCCKHLLDRPRLTLLHQSTPSPRRNPTAPKQSSPTRS